MKRLLVSELSDDELDSLWPMVKEATPTDVGELADRVLFNWTSDELEGEAPVKVEVRRLKMGLAFAFPQWAQQEGGISPVPCWMDLFEHSADQFAPVQFIFDRNDDGETAAKVLVYEDGELEVLARKEAAYSVEPMWPQDGERTCAYGIAGNDHLLFFEDEEE